MSNWLIISVSCIQYWRNKFGTMFKSRGDSNIVYKCTVRLLEDTEILECEFHVSHYSKLSLFCLCYCPLFIKKNQLTKPTNLINSSVWNNYIGEGISWKKPYNQLFRFFSYFIMLWNKIINMCSSLVTRGNIF